MYHKVKKYSGRSSILLVLLVLFTIACSSVKKPIASEMQDPKGIAVPDSIYRFTVSFISKGAGIDHKAQEIFTGFLRDVHAQNKDSIIVEIMKWGREGEIDYCFKLNTLTSEQQLQFIEDTKQLLKNSMLIRYKEYSPGRQKR